MSTGHWITNICFHGLGTPGEEREPGESNYWIAVDLYREILDLVATRDDVRISFDDGNGSDVMLGLPELLARNLTATFFPIANRVDEPGSLSTADIRALVSAGMAVGSHGMRHRSWRGLDEATRREEFDDARAILAEAAGQEVTAVACPLGAYDRSALIALRRRGYRVVHTSDRTRARAGAWMQPRYSVRASDTISDVRALVESAPAATQRLRAQARVVAKMLR